jgi:hypothetical protein
VTDRGPFPDLKVSREALQLVHHHPGRLRVRADKFRVDEETVALVRAGLDRMRGVTRTDHNLRTGSILVEYQPGAAEPEAILAFIADTADLDRYAPTIGPPVQPGLVAIDAVREINAISYELTGKRMDLRTMVPSSRRASRRSGHTPSSSRRASGSRAGTTSSTGPTTSSRSFTAARSSLRRRARPPRRPGALPGLSGPPPATMAGPPSPRGALHVSGRERAGPQRTRR